MDASKVSKVTIVGMGTMGPDIALGFALGGYSVIGVDLNQPVLDRALQKIEADCRQLLEWKLVDEAAIAKARPNITLSLDWEAAVGGADYVMEAVPEVLGLKKQVLGHIGEVCRADVVIASNTSTMAVTEMACDVRNPERVSGTHW